ncbi:dUTP diphosphatase [Pseudochelatococcus lubricantis]|uniref:dUTP diphosphatase n=1 Tax=Pseudochelatococcus lubricantis TaxID=1538102 RepID=UPI0035F0847F
MSELLTGHVLRIVQLPHARGLPLPAYASAAAAGLDLAAAVAEDAPVVIAPGGRALVPTGLVLALPPGTEGQVRPRSGLALKNGVTVLNAPGTIDADYRGEVAVILLNTGSEPFAVTRGLRIAQLIVAPVLRATVEAVDDLDDTARGTGGFGSTGI